MSLDVKVGKDEDTDLSDLIEDESAAPLDDITIDSMKQEVEKMLAELNPREREVLWFRFGLEDGEQWSLRAVGKRLKIRKYAPFYPQRNCRRLEKLFFSKTNRKIIR